MINGLGKFLSRIQIDKGEKAKEMAEKLGVSPVFLSRVMNGKVKCPDDWFDKISSIYRLNKEQKGELIGIIEYSQYYLRKNLLDLSYEDKAIIQYLIINIREIKQGDKDAIRRILFK